MKSSEVRAKAHADGLVQPFEANSILHTEILFLLLIPLGEKKTISLSFWPNLKQDLLNTGQSHRYQPDSYLVNTQKTWRMMPKYM